MYSTSSPTVTTEYKLIDGLTSRYPIGSNINQNHDNIKILAKELNKYLKISHINTANIILVGTGSSGIILCTLLHLYLPDSEIVHVKKNGEESHSHHTDLWTDFSGKTLIFVDDFMCSGSTYMRVYKEVKGMGLTISIACFLGTAHPYIIDEYPVDVVLAAE